MHTTNIQIIRHQGKIIKKQINFFDGLEKELQYSIKKPKILFTDSYDSRIQKNALLLLKKNVATPIFLFKFNEVIPKKVLNKILYIRIPKELSHGEVKQLYKFRNLKDTHQEIINMMKKKEYYAAYLLRDGKVNAVIGGATTSTRDFLVPILKYSEMKKHVRYASSVFILAKDNKTYLFADCAFIRQPNENQLFWIARNALIFSLNLKLYNENKIAFLSYITLDQSEYFKSTVVGKAYERFSKYILPLKNVDALGGIQFDVAFSKEVFSQKIEISPIQKQLAPFNIYIFPNLFSGNIGYKIAQHFGKYLALGPFILGLTTIASDLSRGATEKDIYFTSIIVGKLILLAAKK